MAGWGYEHLKKILLKREHKKYFDECIKDNHALSLRHGAKWESTSSDLYCLVRKLKPKILVETGVQNGHTTEIMLRAIKENGFGKLYSIDSGPTSTDGTHIGVNKTTEGIPGKDILPELKKNWELIVGISSNKLPELMVELNSTVDFFHHDSDHSNDNVRFEFTEMLKHMNKEKYLVLHDFRGQFNTEEKPFNRMNHIIKGNISTLNVFKIVRK